MPVTLDIRDERLREVLDVDAELQTIGSGFRFLEGLIWDPHAEYLTFSDILGNAIHRWGEKSGFYCFRDNSFLANGNTYDRDGNIITCEQATSRISRTKANGTYEVLASQYQDKALNSPDDVIVKRSDGAVYFTDPVYGLGTRVGVPRKQALTFQGVYRLEPETQNLQLLTTDFSAPNGLCFSLDEKQLFINDSGYQHIRVFDVADDGTIHNGKLWAELPEAVKDLGVADGMKIDSAGNLFCSGPGGVHIFSPNAVCLGRILMPEQTANFTWGGEDMRTLFLGGKTTLYRLRVKVAGQKIF